MCIVSVYAWKSKLFLHRKAVKGSIQKCGKKEERKRGLKKIGYLLAFALEKI